MDIFIKLDTSKNQSDFSTGCEPLELITPIRNNNIWFLIFRCVLVEYKNNLMQKNSINDKMYKKQS